MCDGDCMRRKKEARLLRMKKGHLQGMNKQCMDFWQKAQPRELLRDKKCIWALGCLSK